VPPDAPSTAPPDLQTGVGQLTAAMATFDQQQDDAMGHPSQKLPGPLAAARPLPLPPAPIPGVLEALGQFNTHGQTLMDRTPFAVHQAVAITLRPNTLGTTHDMASALALGKG